MDFVKVAVQPFGGAFAAVDDCRPFRQFGGDGGDGFPYGVMVIMFPAAEGGDGFDQLGRCAPAFFAGLADVAPGQFQGGLAPVVLGLGQVFVDAGIPAGGGFGAAGSGRHC